MSNSTLVDEYPVYLLIEPTNNCNFNCIMCPRKEMNRPIGNMDFNLFKKIIDEIDTKVEFIWLHFFGEPFMNKDIFRFIDYAGGRGITLGMSTNASFLSKKNINELLSSKLDLLLISIDSLSHETLQKIRPGCNPSKLIKNIELLVNSQKKVNSPLNIVLSVIDLPYNQEDIKKINSYKEISAGINVILKPFDDFAGQDDEINSINKHKKRKSESKPCFEPWRGFAIGWDGTVVPCCYDFNYKSIIGNLNDNSVLEIWNSEKMQSFRELHIQNRKNENALCKFCTPHCIDFKHGISLFSSFNPSNQECFGYFKKGIYDPEITDDSEIIWTKKEFILLIQDRFKDIKISFSNINPNFESLILDVYLYKNKISSFEIQKETEIKLITPKSLQGRLLRYEFVLDHDWIPKEHKINNDERKLGIIIKNIIN